MNLWGFFIIFIFILKRKFYEKINYTISIRIIINQLW